MSAGKNDMTHRQKVKRLIADLRKQGMSPYTVAPPLFRLLWALGFKVPPPLFLGFLTLTLLTGASFGILWGVVMWQLQWQAWHVPLGLKVIIATGVGLMFGLYMAIYFRWKAKHLRLPPWDSYPREYQQVATRAEKGEVEILQRPRQMNFVLGKNVIIEDMQLVRHLKLPEWNDNTAQVAVTYLQGRRFSNAQILPGLEVVGSRGTWIGNLTSFDMTKIRAKVQLSPLSLGMIAVELDINTFGQYITDWNIAVWRLEIVELHRLLCGLGNIDNVWERFNRDSRAASIRFVYTLMIGGQRFPETWETEIRSLESI